MGLDQQSLIEMVARHVDSRRVPSRVRLHTDTTDFFRVDYDDVLLLAGRPYFIRHYEREGRFGIDEQPKHWVRRAIDLTDGSLKVIKMVFHERFTAHVAGLSYDCVRSPRKEARVLSLVSGMQRFMQGFTVQDEAGNLVRVIDYIKGVTWPEYVSRLGGEYEDFYARHLPGVLDEFIGLTEAVAFLHANGENHGDIRRDHIIKEYGSDLCRWIDFDYNCFHDESLHGYDLAGLGNVLLFVVGRGDVTVQELERSRPDVLARITHEDVNVLFHNRVNNLRKVYPCVSDALNRVLMHFSISAPVFYDRADQLLDDLREARLGMTGG
jgi:hypothetical protein